MNIKMVVGICIVLLASGFCMGCIDDPRAETVEIVEVVSYYNSVAEPGLTVEEFLALSWNAENQYEENEWDCSQMAAYYEWVLENKGVDTIIYVGDTTGNGEMDHAWVGIEMDNDGIYYGYECTGCYWLTQEEIDMWVIHYAFEDIYEIENWFVQNNWNNFLEEFGWWM